MTTQTERMREALERIADPRNTHFAGDAQVVAREALLAADSKAGGEPIGFMNKDDLEWITDESRGVHAFMSTWLYKSAGGDCSVPIFTRPQQQAKPLTDEQMERARIDEGIAGSEMWLQVLYRFARAVERAHGIGDQA